MTNLTKLDISHNYSFNQQTVAAAFNGLTRLTDLRMKDASVPAACVIPLTSLTRLDVNSHIDNSVLRKLTKLTKLNIRSNSKIDARGLESLKELKSLTISSYNAIRDHDLDIFSSQLVALTLLSSHFSDRALAALSGLRKLKFSGCQITDKGITKLRQLTDLDISHTHISDKGIKGLTQLSTLNLIGNKQVTHKGIANLRNLKALFVSENNAISPHLDKLTRLKNLKVFN